jgi:methylase of polypeptide subunit release factors
MVPFLNHGALIFLEMGSGQGDALKKIFSSSVWRAQEVHKDWSGKERFFFLEMQSVSLVLLIAKLTTICLIT